jgi:hypothetical protein
VLSIMSQHRLAAVMRGGTFLSRKRDVGGMDDGRIRACMHACVRTYLPTMYVCVCVRADGMKSVYRSHCLS